MRTSMTGIYAYSSKSNNFSIVIADDLEGNSKSKENKIHLLADRYAIAIYGQDTLNQPIDAISHFTGTKNGLEIPNVSTLAHLIAKHSNTVAPYMKSLYLKALENGQITQKEWDIVLKNDANTVIIDLKNNEIYNVSYGSFFSETPLSPVIQKLPEDTIHRFALAVYGDKSSDKKIASLGPSGLLKNLKGLLYQDKQKITILGNPGTCVYTTPEGIIYDSVYSDPDDLLHTHWKKSFLGFSINVLNAFPNE
jgi:hypothetical protein